MHLTRLRAFAAAFLAATLLSACATDTASRPTPNSSPTQRPKAKIATVAPTTNPIKSPSTPGIPTLPEVMPAIKAYFDGYNRALATSSTTTFRKNFDAGCINCQSEAARLDATFRKNEKYRAGKLIFSCEKIEKGVEGSLTHPIARCIVHQQAWRLTDTEGSLVDSSPASKPLAVSIQVTLRDKRFLVTGIAG